MYLPTVLVGILATEAAVGFYGTAHRVLMAVQTFVNVYFLNFLPLLTQKMHRSPEQVGEILRRSTVLAGAACLLMALVVTASARPVIGLIYGQVYAQSESPLLLSLLIWVIPIFVLRNHARSALIAMGRQRLEMTCSLLGLVALVGGGTYLTAFYGPIGAAWAMIGSELLATALSWGAVKYHWSSFAFEF
jgi:PST family polysaccharide transporter